MARAADGRRIDVQEVLAEAARLHGEGELTEAERLYRRVLALDPDQVEALHLLGAIAAGSGRLDYAVELIGQAIAVAGETPAFHYTLARAFEAEGRVGEALLAQADGLRAEGRLTEAADRYWQALGADADLVGAFVGLGTVLLEQGDGEGAEAMFREALTRRSGDAAAELGLGRTLARRGLDDQAIAHFERALTLDPRCAEAASVLGTLYHRLGDFEVATGWFERAVELRPAAAENRLRYAHLLADRGRPGAGAVQVAKALARRPGWLEALLLQGALLREQGRAAEAALSFARALECDAGCEAARSGLIHLGQLDAALADLPDLPPPAVAAVAEWSGRRDSERRLRVGYVSPEFRRGALAPFLETLLAHHDPAQVEAVCYAEVPRPDMVTSRFQTLAAGWRPTVGVATAALAEWVRADGIDILVDLAGHGPGNRLALFAYHPAPLQVSGLGWPASTGLGLFDGRLTDSLLDPPGGESAGGETILRLPQGFACWRPPAGAPAATAPPTGAPTFGSFNTLAKLSPATVSLWAELLRRVPKARLLLKCKALGDPVVAEGVQARFSRHGIAPARLDLMGPVADAAAHLALYRRVDVALDPLPWNGTATTCEALWMGVPVVTLAGERPASRIGASLLTRAGFPSLVAATPGGYLETAAALASDRKRRAALAGSVRQRLTASPLCDAPAYAKCIEFAYRALWRHWCRGQG